MAAADLFKEAKINLMNLESVRLFRVKLTGYHTTLETHGQRESEFAVNSQLYLEILKDRYQQTDLVLFHEQRLAKLDSMS
jgi:hypothetical protein